MDAKTLIDMLGLQPLALEGGYYFETYRSPEIIPGASMPRRYTGPRSFSTAIYYLLTPDMFSAIHRLRSDEIFHFYTGSPVDMLQLRPDGSYAVITMGNNIGEGEIPQVVVPNGIWQGCKLKDGGEYALLGTTVAPAFDYEDYEQGDREQLIAQYPNFR